MCFWCQHLGELYCCDRRAACVTRERQVRVGCLLDRHLLVYAVTSLGSARPWNHHRPIHIIARRRLFSDHRGERSLLNGRLAATIAGCPSAVHGDRRGVMQHRHFPEPTEPMTRHCSNVAYLSSSVRGRYFGCLGILVQVYTRK